MAHGLVVFATPLGGHLLPLELGTSKRFPGFLGSYSITSVTAGDAWSLLAAEADRCVTELRARQIAIGASARMLCATTLHVEASAAAVVTSGGR